MSVDTGWVTGYYLVPEGAVGIPEPELWWVNTSNQTIAPSQEGVTATASIRYRRREGMFAFRLYVAFYTSPTFTDDGSAWVFEIPSGPAIDARGFAKATAWVGGNPTGAGDKPYPGYATITQGWATGGFSFDLGMTISMLRTSDDYAAVASKQSPFDPWPASSRVEAWGVIEDFGN